MKHSIVDSEPEYGKKRPPNQHKDYEKDLATDLWDRYHYLLSESGANNLHELCADRDIPYKTITNQISSNRLPKVVILALMAKSVNTSIDYLLYGRDSIIHDDFELEVINAIRKEFAFKSIINEMLTMDRATLHHLLLTIKGLKTNRRW